MLKKMEETFCSVKIMSAANVETVRKLKFGVLPHPTYVQLPLVNMFLGLLLAVSEEVEDAVHTWLRAGLKKMFADGFKQLMGHGKSMWRCWVIALKSGSLFVDECLPCNTGEKIIAFVYMQHSFVMSSIM
jgi:hypothetical protein